MSDLERDVAVRWCFIHDCKAYRPPVCGMYCRKTADFDWNPDCDFGWKSFDGRLAVFKEDSTPQQAVGHESYTKRTLPLEDSTPMTLYREVGLDPCSHAVAPTGRDETPTCIVCAAEYLWVRRWQARNKNEKE